MLAVLLQPLRSQGALLPVAQHRTPAACIPVGKALSSSSGSNIQQPISAQQQKLQVLSACVMTAFANLRAYASLHQTTEQNCPALLPARNKQTHQQKMT
jgi:hypothetical protein